MKYYVNDYEQNVFNVFDTLREAEEAFQASHSVECELISMPDTIEEFVEICRNKYGKEVEFCIEYEAEDPYETGNLVGSFTELMGKLGKLLSERRVYYTGFAPILNNKKVKGRWLMYAEAGYGLSEGRCILP